MLWHNMIYCQYTGARPTVSAQRAPIWYNRPLSSLKVLNARRLDDVENRQELVLEHLCQRKFRLLLLFNGNKWILVSILLEMRLQFLSSTNDRSWENPSVHSERRTTRFRYVHLIQSFPLWNLNFENVFRHWETEGFVLTGMYSCP